MSTLVVVLRAVSVLAFAGPMLLVAGRRGGASRPRPSGRDSGRAPVVANLAAFAVFFVSLFVFSGSAGSFETLPLASVGSLLAAAGAALVVRSRARLAGAWSFVAKADEETGLVTTGPYRVVRHPIYLGLGLIAAGAALAFGNWPAFLVVLSGVLPTFAWRARAEEILLGAVFGERYALYRKQTKAIVPYLF